MRKTPPTIRYSLRYQNIPHKQEGRPRIWFLEQQPTLSSDTLRFIKRTLVWLKRQWRKEFLFIFALLFAFVPRPVHVEAISIEPHYLQSVSHLEPAVAVSFAEPEAIAPVVPPAPVTPPVDAPVVASSSCQTYFSGDAYLDNIIRYESGGNSCATNPGGCFGLLQACPGLPLKLACGGDPTCQIAWFEANKTGGRSWAQVWQHELDFGWW